jgi:hypothetical protein
LGNSRGREVAILFLLSSSTVQKILSYFVLIFGFLAACGKTNAVSNGTPVTPVTPKIKPLVLWSGKTQPVGVGWVSPVDTDMSIGIEDTLGHSGNSAVAVHMAHPQTFLESGWQWSTWSDTKETNFALYDTLKISMRVDGPYKTDDLQISLSSPGDHHTTQRLSMKSYDPNLMDGYWHNFNIALKDFYTAGMPFDPAVATQIIVGTWNDNRNFTFFLDDIILTKAD